MLVYMDIVLDEYTKKTCDIKGSAWDSFGTLNYIHYEFLMFGSGYSAYTVVKATDLPFKSQSAAEVELGNNETEIKRDISPYMKPICSKTALNKILSTFLHAGNKQITPASIRCYLSDKDRELQQYQLHSIDTVCGQA